MLKLFYKNYIFLRKDKKKKFTNSFVGSIDYKFEGYTPNNLHFFFSLCNLFEMFLRVSINVYRFFSIENIINI